MRINSIETLGALDGPGIRTVIFFQGCPMRCRYCHNADAFDINGGEEKTAKELLDFCIRYKNYYGKTGGVTLSGGEPLLQANGVLELVKLLKAEGIHTALDTSGAVFAPSVLEAVDLTILDIKHTDPIEFKKLTGFSMNSTLKSLEYLQKNKKRFIIRQVILSGVTDGIGQIKKLKEMSKGTEKIELLPYHSMGADKWQRCGLEYPLKNAAATPQSVMAELERYLKEQ